MLSAGAGQNAANRMKLALIGVGLIGGSFAKALSAAGKVERIVGFDTDTAALKRAVELGVIDEAAASPTDAGDGADLVMIAVPVGSIAGVFRQIAPGLSETAIVTDVGSTKASVIEAARSELGSAFSRFVPGHPIAGSDRSGIEESRADLFDDAIYVSTANEQTQRAALQQVEELWRAIGCRIERMSPDEHDRVFAAVSHLPHVLAYALVAHISAQPDAQRKFAMAGPGFGDMTRIAGSNPALWADICRANRQALAVELRNFRALLDVWQRAVETGEQSSLRQFFESATTVKRAIDARNYLSRS